VHKLLDAQSAHAAWPTQRKDIVIEELFSKPVLVFGCGNPLFGDDGFGPEVIAHLHDNFPLPPSVAAVDVGTSIGDYLFDLVLTPQKPSHIFIVDAISQPQRPPGEIFELDIEQVPVNKSGDFSLHQFPSVNLLLEMRNLAGVDVRILAVQVKHIPDFVQPGLSKEVEAAIPQACMWLLRQVEAALREPAGG
jgi:coenzyme F420 hydrogenase subunit delta